MPVPLSTYPQTLADAAERLMATYEPWLPLSSVTAVIAECRRQLTVATYSAMSPVSVYRAANERLKAMVDLVAVAT